MKLMLRGAISGLALLTLAQCTTEAQVSEGPAVEAPGKFEELLTVVTSPERKGPILIRQDLDEATVENVLDALIDRERYAALRSRSVRQRVKALMDGEVVGPDGVPLNQGIGGISLAVLLKGILATTNGGEGFKEPVKADLKGQIEDYNYDPMNRSGSMTVLVWSEITDQTKTVKKAAPAYRYQISVAPKRDANNNPVTNGFMVLTADLTVPNDPFPNTVPLPPGTMSRVLSGDLNFKLWAKGTDISVDEVWEAKSYDPSGQNTFTPVPSSSPLRMTTTNSCIDMLFQDLPPKVFPAGFAPPSYCLGRCKDPKIINTK